MRRHRERHAYEFGAFARPSRYDHHTRGRVQRRWRSSFSFRKGSVLKVMHSLAAICIFGAGFAALLPACGGTDSPPPSGDAGAPGVAGSNAATAGSNAATAGSNAATAGSTSSAGGPSAGGSSVGSVANGATVWAKEACATCHGESAAGLYAPNITFSTTAGIGTWTEPQFRDAVRLGKDPRGVDLCMSMTRYSASEINDAAMADLYAYLRSKPTSDVKMQGSLCP
jgi:hypothetical protein